MTKEETTGLIELLRLSIGNDPDRKKEFFESLKCPELTAGNYESVLSNESHDRLRLEVIAKLQSEFPDDLMVHHFATRVIEFNFDADFHWAKKRICAIVASEHHIGSGFLVGEDLVMTNYHVYEALNSTPGLKQAVFDKHRDSQSETRVEFAIDDSRLIVLANSISSELDYAVLKLAKPVGNSRGYFKLSPQRPPENSPVYIVGYPGLGTSPPSSASLELSAGRLSGWYSVRSRQIANYSAKTAPGSSGSPVFTQGFRLIAIHHQGESATQKHGISMISICNELREWRSDPSTQKQVQSIASSADASDIEAVEHTDPAYIRDVLNMQATENVAYQIGEFTKKVRNNAAQIITGGCLAATLLCAVYIGVKSIPEPYHKPVEAYVAYTKQGSFRHNAIPWNQYTNDWSFTIPEELRGTHQELEIPVDGTQVRIKFSEEQDLSGVSSIQQLSGWINVDYDNSVSLTHAKITDREIAESPARTVDTWLLEDPAKVVKQWGTISVSGIALSKFTGGIDPVLEQSPAGERLFSVHSSDLDDSKILTVQFDETVTIEGKKGTATFVGQPSVEVDGELKRLMLNVRKIKHQDGLQFASLVLKPTAGEFLVAQGETAKEATRIDGIDQNGIKHKLTLSEPIDLRWVTQMTFESGILIPSTGTITQFKIDEYRYQLTTENREEFLEMVTTIVEGNTHYTIHDGTNRLISPEGFLSPLDRFKSYRVGKFELTQKDNSSGDKPPSGLVKLTGGGNLSSSTLRKITFYQKKVEPE